MTRNTNNALEPARASVARFEALLAEKGLYWDIVWRWVGRSRCGVIRVRNANRDVVDRELYGRNTQLWTSNDRGLERIHTGAPKHQAVLELLSRLSKEPA